MRTVEGEARPATPEEQAALARWSGWGAAQEIFDEGNASWAREHEQLRALLSEAEWAGARRTTLNAHYTDPSVAAAMWSAAESLGFDGGRVLEPGCGAGMFMAHAPDKVAITGVEKDSTTAGIARLLYPDADIRADRFEDFDTRAPFDLVVGNVPFAKVTPVDQRYNRGRHTLHNYFLIKSLRLVQPGGLMMALTSRYTMDARNPAARRELAQYGDLVGALRLPGGAMRRIAGTDAIMDLLVLQRRAPGAEARGVVGWDQTVKVDYPVQDDEGTGESAVNAYFADNPQHVLGKAMVGRGMYRDGDLVVRSESEDIGSHVADGLASIVAATDLRYEPAAELPSTDPVREAPRQVGDVELVGDRLTPLRRKSFVISRTGIIYQHEHGELTTADVPRSSVDEVRHLISLRDLTGNLLRLEADDAPSHEIEGTRTQLADSYERYVRRWGPLNRVSWQRTGRTDPETGEDKFRRVPARLGGFRQDPEWMVLAAIETYDEDTGVASPAAIQRQRVVHPAQQRLGAETPEEAMAVSLDESGRVELDRVAELLGIEPADAMAELGPFVYEDPRSGELVPAETYLSGNVRTKLSQAQDALASDDRWQRNVDALEGVQPAQIAPGDIVVRPGVPWIPNEDVEAFGREVLGLSSLEVTYDTHEGKWKVDVSPSAARSGYAAENDWATTRVSAQHLLGASLNQRLVRVYDTTFDDKRVLNVAETTAGREKQEELAERFSSWVWESPERAERLSDTYNELFNSYVPPDYEAQGTRLTFPGLVEGFTPHGHQQAAVARILREGRALLGHSVGAGKTASMVMAAMEMRRLGIADRPAMVVPNHMLEQFSREFLQLYPQARVLAVTKDLTGKAGRQEFVARAATGEWDAVVMTHSAFERLPLRRSTYQEYVNELLSDLRADIEAARSAGNYGTVKEAEYTLAQEEAKYERLLSIPDKDEGVCWEETGIDMLFVDELHLFKNLAFTTSVEGVQSTGSKRATDLDIKLWHLQRTDGTRSIVGATATPIANSIAEAWVMQRYVQPDVLAEGGLDRFDAWAATFARQVAAVELAPDGGSYRVASRLAKYQNVPELIGMFRRTADIRLREDLDLKVPTLRGGGPESIIVPASEDLEGYVSELVTRAEAVRSKAVEPKQDNMLKITGDGRHAALDLRLVDLPPDPTGGKITAAAERIARTYHDTRDLTYLDDQGTPSPTPGGFQLVFCDISTPRDDGEWNSYDELREQLTDRGVPSEQVAAVHDARNDEARGQLFAKCRNGQIAILIGSTSKMGVGTNIHSRAVALHHLDCPWRPADIEQRDGRVIRQGNQNDEVQILRYATEGSFDVYMWQTVERKAGFIAQVMRGENVGRDLDDVGDAVLSYSEVKALASGNPLVMEQAGVQADMVKYERLEQAHIEQQREFEATAAGRRAYAQRLTRKADQYREAIGKRVDTTGDQFAITIDGQQVTKRTEATESLRGLLDQTFRELDATKGSSARTEERIVAQLGDFDVALTGHRLTLHKEAVFTVFLTEDTNAEIRLKPDDLADSKVDLAQRLESPIKRLDDRLERTLAEAEECLQEAESLEGRVGQPFQHAQTLAKLRTRYQEILDQLNEEAADGATISDADIPQDGAAQTEEPPGPARTAEAASSTPDPIRRLDRVKISEPRPIVPGAGL